MHHFADIIGEDRLTGHLKEAIAGGRESHAYIIAGPRGSGKMMLAETFAASLLCTGRGEGGAEPCGQCLSCIQASGHNHPDIIYVGHEKPKSVGVGDIRSMREDTAIKPYQSSHKVYILDDAELMTAAAQNALLKTLEEPPSYVCILLLAESTEPFLPTVLSRCAVLRMQPVPEEMIAEYLVSGRAGAVSPDGKAGDRPAAVSPGWARICAGFSGGSVGKALSLAADAVFRERREETVRLLSSIGRMDSAALLSFAAETAKDAEALAQTGEFIRMWYRDVMRYAVNGDGEGLFYADEEPAVAEASLAIPLWDLAGIMDAIDEFDYRMKYNASAVPAFASLLLKLRRKQAAD